MRLMSDLNKEEKLSAVETTLAASNHLTEEQKQEIRNKLASNLGEDSEIFRVMELLLDPEGQGSPGGQGGQGGPTRKRNFFPGSGG